MENMPLPEADLVLAGAVFQWAVSLSGLISRLQHLLPAGGILAFSTFGPENLREIAALTGRSLCYPPMNEVVALLRQNQFSILKAQEERVCLTFPAPMDALRHLRETGVNSLKATRVWSRHGLERFALDYRRCFGLRGGQYPLSYHPVWIIAQKTGLFSNNRDHI